VGQLAKDVASSPTFWIVIQPCSTPREREQDSSCEAQPFSALQRESISFHLIIKHTRFESMLRLQDAVVRQPKPTHIRSAIGQVSRHASPSQVPLSTPQRRQGQGKQPWQASRTGASLAQLFPAFAPDCFDMAILAQRLLYAGCCSCQ
jgi:hypothetical protein